MFVCCVFFLLSGRGLCDELITPPEETYRLWRVVVCDHEEAISCAGLQTQRKQITIITQCIRQGGATDCLKTKKHKAAI
jgi:hypothetical protein